MGEISAPITVIDSSNLPRKPRIKKKKSQKIMLEGYVESLPAADKGSDGGESIVSRTKSLTNDDLEELKGCLDLGFGFNYDEIDELCNTLPALELSSNSISNWKFSRPGDSPEEVKARLKYWAQAVACTVKLCSNNE